MDQTPPEPSIRCREFGRLPDGRVVHDYALANGAGMTLSAINLGGIITSIHVPDRRGHRDNVVLGFDTLADYVERNPYFGVIAGRYANRIAGGRFELDGAVHQLDINDGPNTLHGGARGFGTRWWDITPELSTAQGVALRLEYTSEHGEAGFPGRLAVTVRYTLTTVNEWRVDFRATTDPATVVNLTQHAYFNLAGSGSALDHRLTIAASRYLPVDRHLIPLGLAEVAGTPFDFRAPTRIAERIRHADPQLALARGYDHSWVLDRPSPHGLTFAARLEDETSGRILEIATTEPGLQFYSGNFLDGSLIGSGGALYRQGDAVCLETQHFPNSPNRPEFPSTVLRPGAGFVSTTLYRFSVR